MIKISTLKISEKSRSQIAKPFKVSTIVRLLRTEGSTVLPIFLVVCLGHPGFEILSLNKIVLVHPSLHIKMPSRAFRGDVQDLMCKGFKHSINASHLTSEGFPILNTFKFVIINGFKMFINAFNLEIAIKD